MMGSPWSCAAGTKCGWMRPNVVAPQIAIPPARYQNGRVRAASASARSATRAAPMRTTGGSSSGVPP